MKTHTLLTIAAVAVTLQFAPTALAQPADGSGQKRGWRQQQMMANLTQEERTKLRAAHHRAMADPAVLAAQDRMRQAAREFRELKRQTMLRGDPSLQPILEKMPQRGMRGS